MTYREAARRIADQLKGAGIENESAESMFLMEYACGVSRSFYLLHQMEEMPETQWERYREAARKRCRHIPLQHLTGEQEFMGIPFLVNEHVLIPRQDTEILVEEALKIVNRDSDSGGNGRRRNVLDLCTGSGCIAVSLKAFRRDLSVTACDISREALAVARENAKRNQTEIQFVASDLFSGISGNYDMIVSNPPYIPREVIPTLMPEVREHEPVLALDGGPDGLEFYRKIVYNSQEYLTAGGWLLLEIGYDQGKAVSGYMRENYFRDIEVIRDLAGLDRVVKGRRE